MAVPWLLIAVVGLAATEVSCQTPEVDIANPPPPPTAGVNLCTNSAYMHVCVCVCVSACT